MTTNVAKKNKSKSLTFENFINKTYGYMFSGILITIITSFIMLKTSLVLSLFNIDNGFASLNILGYLAFYGPLGILLFLSFKKLESISLNGAKFIFFVLSVMFGLMMSVIVINTNINIVFQCLTGAGAIFAGSALIGHYIKSDLSFLGRIAYNLMFGLVVISIIALFLKSPLNNVIISYSIIGLSSILVAYTHQNLKSIYSYFNYHSEESDKIAIFGALSLYIDFINIFTSLLNLSNRR